MIIKTFAAYISCKQELIDIEIEREEYFQSLPGTSVPGITYSDERGSRSMKSNKSYISDKLEQWEKQKQPFINYCNQVITLCDNWLIQMDEDVRKIFTLRYIEGKTQREVANITGYERSSISKIIREQSAKLKHSHM